MELKLLQAGGVLRGEGARISLGVPSGHGFKKTWFRKFAQCRLNRHVVAAMASHLVGCTALKPVAARGRKKLAILVELVLKNFRPLYPLYS